MARNADDRGVRAYDEYPYAMASASVSVGCGGSALE
jgi:hypothetical protein